MFKKRDRQKKGDKVIDIQAGMEGNLKFSTPVNLRISGSFVGELDIKGSLAIGEKADVQARVIKGENISISGKVKGDIICSKRLEIFAPAKIIGNIKTPTLIINEGAMLKGKCQMPAEDEKSELKRHSKKKR